MASMTIYPPLVNSYEPAFVAGSNSSLRVYFSLSSLSNIPEETVLTVHAQIYRQDGVKVLKTTNDGTRYRSTGILLNLVPVKVDTESNLYYITIENSDLKSSDTLNGTTYRGWIPGWIYKIQLRLSDVIYSPSEESRQEVWLQKNSDHFSEWSTICYTKAISNMRIQIPLFNYDSKKSYNFSTSYVLKDVNFFGTIESELIEANEDFEYVQVSLYRNSTLLEDSGEIYKTEQSDTYFSYRFKRNFQENIKYTLKFNYKTENGYVPNSPLSFNFYIDNNSSEIINAQLITIDKNFNNLLQDLTSLDEEEDEGRIALKIYSPSEDPWTGNICIRRASQEDNFQTWEDITIFTVKAKNLNTLDLIYDYTITSGVWYKYGIQSINTKGERGVLNIINNPIQRLFNYSYLLGKGGQQLKLQFNNTINNYKYQLYDSKVDTIGSQYPFISRNATVNYRVFSISALISFWMDENNTFLKNGKKDIYNFSNIVKLYDDYVEENSIRKQYDYTYERDFRKMVLDFLQDGKPKLFKSPTEGNMIVRLTDVSCSPNQTLDRMIYSVTMNVNEFDDDTMNNYIKYGFYNPGTYSNNYTTTIESYIGQLTGKFTTNDNIFQKIYAKYDSQGNNYSGYKRELNGIQHVRVTINGYYHRVNGVETFVAGNQLRIYNSQNQLVLGNNMRLSYSNRVSNLLITIYSPNEVYEFDDLITFHYGKNGYDSLYLLGDAQNSVTGIDATIDFVYTLNIEAYGQHEIKNYNLVEGISQFYEEVNPGTSIYNIIYSQHYFESNTTFKRLYTISDIEIEANPHTVFLIKTGTDTEARQYEIGDTGTLSLNELNNITEIKYVGKRYLKVDYDDSTVSEEIITENIIDNEGHYVLKASADVSLTYNYIDRQGTYK